MQSCRKASKSTAKSLKGQLRGKDRGVGGELSGVGQQAHDVRVVLQVEPLMNEYGEFFRSNPINACR